MKYRMTMNTKLAATPRTPKPKTRDRILARSLELFNEQGERQMSTNHIAAALGIVWAAGHRLFDPQPIQQVGCANFRLPLKFCTANGKLHTLETSVTGTVSLQAVSEQLKPSANKQ